MFQLKESHIPKQLLQYVPSKTIIFQKQYTTSVVLNYAFYKRATIVHFEPRFLTVQISLTLQQTCQRPVILIIQRSLVVSGKWRHENPQFAHTLYSHVICTVLTTYTDNFLNTINPLNAKLNNICHLLALLEAHHIFHVSGLRVNRPPFIMKAVKAFCKVGIESPSTIEINFDLQRGKKINMTFVFRSQDI